MDPSHEDRAHYAVSVIIPTRDRHAPLRECLRALANSTAEEPFEVIVVNDGGRDCSEPLIDALGEALDLRVLRQAPSGPARARNAGGMAARAPLLAFIDDDCLPEPDWIPRLLRTYGHAPEAMIGGRVHNGVGNNDYSQASQVLLEYLYRRSNPDPSDADFFASCNLAVPRDLFLATGGFDESYPFAAAEDRDLCRRWKARGGRLVYAPDALVHHFHVLDLRTFLRQHFRYGRGSRRFRRRARGSGGESVGFEQAGFYFGIIAAPFQRMPLLQATRVASLLALSQVATITGFVWELVHPARAAGRSPVISEASEKDRAEGDPAA